MLSPSCRRTETRRSSMCLLRSAFSPSRLWPCLCLKPRGSLSKKWSSTSRTASAFAISAIACLKAQSRCPKSSCRKNSGVPCKHQLLAWGSYRRSTFTVLLATDQTEEPCSLAWPSYFPSFPVALHRQFQRHHHIDPLLGRDRQWCLPENGITHILVVLAVIARQTWNFLRR